MLFADLVCSVNIRVGSGTLLRWRILTIRVGRSDMFNRLLFWLQKKLFGSQDRSYAPITPTKYKGERLSAIEDDVLTHGRCPDCGRKQLEETQVTWQILLVHCCYKNCGSRFKMNAHAVAERLSEVEGPCWQGPCPARSGSLLCQGDYAEDGQYATWTVNQSTCPTFLCSGCNKLQPYCFGGAPDRRCDDCVVGERT